MRLSEAILLGRNLCESEINPDDPTNKKGCALTMASLAVGARSKYGINLWHEAKRVWTWLGTACCCGDCSGDYMFHIALLFDREVMTGKMTLEQLVDYVRSIEPAEPSAIERAIQSAELYPRIPDSDTENSMHSGRTFEEITAAVERAEKAVRS